ncbi:MAG: hypothetical protein KGH87_06610 [Thaumarchaeota archaeon]|nr:hypothetical protein [Nitrososphaerota archaeon]
MNYQFTTDIKADVLTRGDEPTDGTSDYDAQSLVYINRACQLIYEGGMEIDPDVREDWIWLYKKGILTLVPEFNTGTISLTQNSTAGSFSQAPTDPSGAAISVQNWFLRAVGWQDVPVISAHTSGQTSFTLDAPWTGTTGSYSFDCFQLTYQLNSDVLRLQSPMWVRTVVQSFPFQPNMVAGMDLEAVRTMWPLDRIVAGVPSSFAQMMDTNISTTAYCARFNTYSPALQYLRVEYDYLYKPADLAAAVNEQPVIPINNRRILADVALYFLFIDKNDSRAAAALDLAQKGLRALARENRLRRMAGDQTFGQLYPRVARMNRMMPFRTSGGLIVG